MPLATVLDTLFGFLLNWPPLLAVIFVSFVISLVSLLVTKFTTDQTEMKRLKDELDANQKKMKTLRDDPGKMMEIQKQTMATHAQYFRKSMIPTLVMLIPLGLLFNWMGAHFGHEPLNAGEEFLLRAIAQEEVTGNVSLTAEGLNVTSNAVQQWSNGEAVFRLSGPNGDYLAEFSSNNASVQKSIIVADNRYAPVSETYKKNSAFKEVRIENKELDLVWRIGWLGTYIISAIVFISVLRKLLKVY